MNKKTSLKNFGDYYNKQPIFPFHPAKQQGAIVTFSYIQNKLNQGCRDLTLNNKLIFPKVLCMNLVDNIIWGNERGEDLF